MSCWLDHSRSLAIVHTLTLAASAVVAWLGVQSIVWRIRLLQSRQAAATRLYNPDACDPIGGGAGASVRMTLLADVHEAGEVERAEAWLQRHRDRLTYISEQGGCGCCVVDWDLEGPREVVETLPNGLRCDSEWTRGERPRR